MKSIFAIIEWYGPYTLEEAKFVSKSDYGDGLYMVIGKIKDEDSSRLQYIGIAKNINTRLNGQHHKIPNVIGDPYIWLGEIVSPRTPGRKIKVTDRMLDLAEWAHAYFLQLPLNTAKKKQPPDREIIVYNRWWQKDYITPYRKRPHNEWPDIIDFLGNQYNSKVVWFGSKHIVKLPTEFIP
jgi:hypothetical protein